LRQIREKLYVLLSRVVYVTVNDIAIVAVIINLLKLDEFELEKKK
jgi:hypothetical protein